MIGDRPGQFNQDVSPLVAYIPPSSTYRVPCQFAGRNSERKWRLQNKIFVLDL